MAQFLIIIAIVSNFWIVFKTFFFLQDLFVVRHELAIMRLAAFMGITMLVGITGLFYTQLIGIITVSMFLMYLWTYVLIMNLILKSYKKFRN